MDIRENLKSLKIYDTQPKLKYFQGRHFALHEYQAIYFEVPKAACSSIIMKCADLINLNIDKESIHSQNNKNKIPKINQELLHSEYNNYYKFTFVRNPWDRLVSCYKDKIREDENFNAPTFKNGIHAAFLKYGIFKAGMNFTDFVSAVCEIPDEQADAHILSQHQFLINNQGVVFMDFIGRFETLQDDFNLVCNKLNISDNNLPHKNRSNSKLQNNQRNKYSDYYCKYTRKLVAKRYDKDINLFDYEFTE